MRPLCKESGKKFYPHYGLLLTATSFVTWSLFFHMTEVWVISCQRYLVNSMGQFIRRASTLLNVILKSSSTKARQKHDVWIKVFNLVRQATLAQQWFKRRAYTVWTKFINITKMCIFKFHSGTTLLNQNPASLLLLLNSIVLLSSARQKHHVWTGPYFLFINRREVKVVWKPDPVATL